MFPCLDICVIFLCTIAGVFEFEKRKESVVSDEGVINIKVTRQNGDKGTVTVTIRAIADTATENLDYTLEKTSLDFANTEVYYNFQIQYTK